MGFTPRLDHLATRLAPPARFFAGMVAGMIARKPALMAAQAAIAATAGAREAATGGFRIDVAMHPVSPEAEAWAQVEAVHAAMAQAGQWPDLLSALRAADCSRIAIGGGKRVVELVSAGARAALTGALARGDRAAAEAELGNLRAVAAAHPADYAAAHLLARGHLDMAAALHETATSAGDAAARAAHVGQAEAALDPFDPLECSSPLLAGTRYLLVRDLPEAAEFFRDWYEDWADLDPGNWTAHATHAPQLLAGAFGSARAFEARARAAAARTSADMGAAAYAMFQMAAGRVSGALPVTMDLALMLQGLADFQAQTGCQHRANIAAAQMAELAHALHLDGPGAAPKLALVQAALRRLVTTRLRAFHLSDWENGEHCIRWAMEQAFGPDLRPGARIIAGDAGLRLAD